MRILYYLFAVIFILIGQQLYAQSFTLNLAIKNQPDSPVIIGTISGEKFLPIDTLNLQHLNPEYQTRKVIFEFPSDAAVGMYRIILGQTTYARVMGESPQQLDFIFNHENIVFETDFKAPPDSLRILQSDENKLWFSFLAKDKEYRTHFNLLEKEVDYFQLKLSDDNFSSDADMGRSELERNAMQKANAFNELQMERDRLILHIIQENGNMFASRLIRLFRAPFRDGYLTQEERKESFQKAYFNHFDFSDRLLINSPVLADKIFDYLVTWNQRGFTQEQREIAYIKAVDVVMSHIEPINADKQSNNPVYEFVLNYMVTGFERLNMEKVLNYIAENYLDNLCLTYEKSTLARKLGALNMKLGSVVPDFTLNDLNGDPVTLSEVLKPRVLIFFWASWCSYCTEMLPHIKAWYNQNQPKDFDVIAISLDSSKEEWHKAVFDSGFEMFYNLSDLQRWDGKTAEDYNVYATPTMFLINHERKILAKPNSVNDLINSAGKN